MRSNLLWAAISIVGLFFLTGCQTVGQTTEKPFQNYRAELEFDLSGRTYQGFAVTKIAPGGALDIAVRAPITLNRVEISTCSRHEVIRNSAKGWFGKIDSSMNYRYQPTKAEMEGECPLFIQAFNDHVQKAWGMIAFRSDQTLPAHMDCNGAGWEFSGISVCGTKAGLEEQLVFKTPVEFEAQPSCKISTQDKLTFNVRTVGVGWCKAVFSDGERFHDLILHGYDEVTVY